MPDPNPALAAAARLRAALDATADALARPNLEALLAAEDSLTGAYGELPRLRTLNPGERALARAELLAAQAALLRCERLGASLTEFVRTSLAARGEATGYDPASTATTMTGRGFQTRA